MSIAIIGTGNMAKGLAGLFSQAGIAVTLGARTVEKGTEAVAALGNGVDASDIAHAVAKKDVVILAVPYDAAADALKAAGDLSGKILIDITNPLTADYMGLTIGHGTSAAAQIADIATGARVVKAFNTLFAQVLQGGGKVGGAAATVFIAGDDAAANDTVADLVVKIGLKPVKTGALKQARYLEPVAGLNISLGYGQGFGTAIAPTWSGIA
ncbi:MULTISPECIES: NADPH-dependent F420 reductase [unclassified Rhizobium]|uniref:NADPH-dependent F420 reductase n=1 Tax=unclassified Rhizobium TaxID=2613769 RepID=UPI001ADC9AFC|nr:MULTISPECIES: NAD(P)-binding domain-containing protein [unclassified Rhizobium]MBO9123717.1 NAD(P)-binding domain-containing protein [Rhizobium sp. 16-488-2b]MBO9174249.1 NAD(P)-binding domain-containing protein [Rhizobium sp. 16-488-2a]